MTSTDSTNNPETTSAGRRRRRNVDPAASLLAHGEPFVWLTSASLVLCILMICGMVALIVYQGSITFWPAPVTRVTLLDDTAFQGEITRYDSYRLTAEKVAGLSPNIRAAAEKFLGGETSKVAHRRLFRTGNFELTQSHYRWVDDYEVTPEGESKPEWVVVLERVEWGRFYGQPQEFVKKTVREPTGDELDLAAQLEFLELNLFRVADDQRPTLEKPLEKLRQSLADVRQKNVSEFVSSEKPEGSTRLDAELDDHKLVRADALTADPNVVALQRVVLSSPKSWQAFNELHQEVRARVIKKRHLEKEDLGAINDRINDARLLIRSAEMAHHVSLLAATDEIASLENQLDVLEADREAKSKLGSNLIHRFADEPTVKAAIEKIVHAFQAEVVEQKQAPERRLSAIREKLAKLPGGASTAVEKYLEISRAAVADRSDVQRQITRLDEDAKRFELRLLTASGQTTPVKVADVVIGYLPNQLSWWGKMGVYGQRWREFLLDEPREANSEGGVFPAIFGTVLMTLIMSLAVVPFGVLAALYLREYAKTGTAVSIVRIAINNLAGVPSIVFGVFGLGFFCYIIGAYIDGGPKHAGLTPWSSPIWLASLGGLAVVAVTAFLFGFFGMSTATEDSPAKRWLRRLAVVLWIGATLLLFGLIFFNPYFDGLYANRLPNPTFGKGGLLWASLTLSLLTLPVVIVATEEALSAVPNSMREGSYACGAGKWQTIHRIVLPQAAPGIMTGMILAMARGAGEVAPLMLVGAVKLAPELPWLPYRSFMHLGFHIYDLGFQSPNSEAAKPMVYTTTLLLILIIGTLNVSAVWMRNRLRKRFKGGQF